MPLQIQLTGTGPGQGVFDISGGELAGESFELAVQRSSDEKFLGTDLLWQNAPYWHVCYRIDGEPERLRLAAGAEIVDGVVESSVHALRVLVRAGRVQAQGILRTRRLVGSPAGSGRSEPEQVLPPPIAENPRPLPDSPPPPPPIEQLPEPPPRRARLVLLLLAVALVAAGAAAWYFGLFDPLFAPEQDDRNEIRPSAEPPEDSANRETWIGNRPEPGDSSAAPGQAGPEPRAPPDPAPGLSGRALVQQYLEEEPSAEDLYARAQDREQAADCEAAILLYTRAASADPKIAGRVARLYDPAGFKPSPCVESPNRENAMVWYQDAARAGVLAAQSRIGALLVDGSASGVSREQGIEWLRKAAAGGDTDAERTLRELDQR